MNVKMYGNKKRRLKKLFSCEKYSVRIHAALFSECKLWDKDAIPNAKRCKCPSGKNAFNKWVTHSLFLNATEDRIMLLQ